jgi:putative two-component system response regulator
MIQILNARILIVDDNLTNIRLLERILLNGGLSNFRSLQDGRNALAAVKELEPDLILLDLHMPEVDGFEVIKQVREMSDDQTYLPILVLTADVNPAVRNKALAMGAKDFLSKPLDAIEVLLRVRNLLETRFLYKKLNDDFEDYRHQIEDV